MKKIISRKEYYDAMDIILQYHKQIGLYENEEIKSKISELSDVYFSSAQLGLVSEMKLTSRAYNGLRSIFYNNFKTATLLDLSKVSSKQIVRYRNCGLRTLAEYKEVLISVGLDFED